MEDWKDTLEYPGREALPWKHQALEGDLMEGNVNWSLEIGIFVYVFFHRRTICFPLFTIGQVGNPAIGISLI